MMQEMYLSHQEVVEGELEAGHEVGPGEVDQEEEEGVGVGEGEGILVMMLSHLSPGIIQIGCCDCLMCFVIKYLMFDGNFCSCVLVLLVCLAISVAIRSLVNSLDNIWYFG